MCFSFYLGWKRSGILLPFFSSWTWNLGFPELFPDMGDTLYSLLSMYCPKLVQSQFPAALGMVLGVSSMDKRLDNTPGKGPQTECSPASQRSQLPTSMLSQLPHTSPTSDNSSSCAPMDPSYKRHRCLRTVAWPWHVGALPLSRRLQFLLWPKGHLPKSSLFSRHLLVSRGSLLFTLSLAFLYSKPDRNSHPE